MKRLLLHICCGPCAVYPLRILRELEFETEGFFYNPNIHPYREFTKRLNSLRDFAAQQRLKLFCDTNYGLTEFLRQVVFREQERCGLCYRIRLEATVLQAKKEGFDAFSTTLLYSRYQRHEWIRSIGEELASLHNLHFLYQDFRVGWQDGIDGSVELGLYRQPYCGCIYSEQERYDKKLRKKTLAINNIHNPAAPSPQG